MTLPLPPLDSLGWLFISMSLVFTVASLVALWAILQRGGSTTERATSEDGGPAEREWWASDDDPPARPGARAVVEELIWLAVPVLMLIWLWRSI